jgi:hypothetical protein
MCSSIRGLYALWLRRYGFRRRRPGERGRVSSSSATERVCSAAANEQRSAPRERNDEACVPSGFARGRRTSPVTVEVLADGDQYKFNVGQMLFSLSCPQLSWIESPNDASSFKLQ